MIFPLLFSIFPPLLFLLSPLSSSSSPSPSAFSCYNQAPVRFGLGHYYTMPCESGFCMAAICGVRNYTIPPAFRGCVSFPIAEWNCRWVAEDCGPWQDQLCYRCNSSRCNSRESDRQIMSAVGMEMDILVQNVPSEKGNPKLAANIGKDINRPIPKSLLPTNQQQQQKRKHVEQREQPKIIQKLVHFPEQRDYLSEFVDGRAALVIRALIVPICIFGTFYLLCPSRKWLLESHFHAERFIWKDILEEEAED